MTTHDTHKPASTAAKISSPVQRKSEQAAAEPETERTEQSAAPQLADRLHGQQQARMMQRMQRTVGNAQVQRMLSSPSNQSQVQRTPAAPKRAAPQQDPRFQAVTAKTKQVATKEKQHAPAKTKATEAQAAAQGPANDVSSQAAAAQVGKMSAQQPGMFNKGAFIAALNKAITQITPKNQEEADEFKQSGKAGELKGQVTGLVKDNKESAEQNIETTTKEAPSPGNAQPKSVTPMKPEEAGPAPGVVGAGNAMPANKTPQETSLAQGPQSLDQQMAKADVTEEQIKKSNEPSFTNALTAKKQAETHATTAPQQFRAQEKTILGQARNEAGALEQQAFSGMHTGRVGALGKVLGNKTTAKGQDERKRAEVATKIEGLYTKTKTDVTGILDALDGKVNGAFDRGEAGARAAFEKHVDAKMKAYKEQRYSGLLGPGKWVKDKIMGMPPEVNAFFQEGRKLYLDRMQTVISTVADVVGNELNRAKIRIAQGRQEIQTYVNGLPKDLRKVGQEAAENIQSRFDQLEQDVNNKQDALVQSLAQKYVSARDAVDSRITDMQKANQGLVAKAMDALGGVIQTILELKNMLLGVLSRAASVIGTIIKDPVRFLGNLIGAVKQGLNKFLGNIGKHLEQGLMGWLVGTVGGAGIRLPESLDLKGILSLVMQVMGLTYANIRARAVKLVGERTVGAMEKTAQVFQLLASEGPTGLWQLIQDKVGDLKTQVLGQIQEFVITKIITAGITWLLSLFNPAAAFIKACKMIYDVIMFFIERGSQIMELVNAILDSVSAIAGGAIGDAANKVEQALGKALPVAISFLASLIGIGGVSDRVRKIISSVQKPINSAIDGVLKAAAKGFGKLTGKDKAKPGSQQSAARTNPADDQRKVHQGVMAGVSAVNKLRGKTVGEPMLKPILSALRMRYGLGVLEPVVKDQRWAVHGELRRETVLTEVPVGFKISPRELCDLIQRIGQELLQEAEVKKLALAMDQERGDISPVLQEDADGKKIRGDGKTVHVPGNGGMLALTRHLIGLQSSRIPENRQHHYVLGAGKEHQADVYEEKKAGDRSNWFVRGVGHYVHPKVPAKEIAHQIDEIKTETGLTDQQIGKLMKSYIASGEISFDGLNLKADAKHKCRNQLAKIVFLMFGRESARDELRGNVVHAAMVVDMVSNGDMSLREATTNKTSMSMKRAQKLSGRIRYTDEKKKPRIASERSRKAHLRSLKSDLQLREQFRKRQNAIIEPWLTSQIKKDNTVFADKQQLKEYVYKKMRGFYGLS